MAKYKQALLSLAIRLVVVGVVAALDYLSAGLTNGTVQLPDPTITVPLLGIIVSEADTWLVNWEKNNPPVPAA